MKDIIFSDLDGTLLNHNDYSFDDALPMLELIKKRDIPLIFTTSKTKNECEILQKKMGITSPFIVENGAAIYGFEGGVIELGVKLNVIREFMQSIKDEFEILAFSFISVKEVMQHTSFGKDEATMAKNREYSEPFLIKDERHIQKIQTLANRYGMKILKGGRFYHCVGKDQDKGRAVEKVLDIFGKDLYSIGLGDNYNDLDMLRVVNTPILLPTHTGEYIKHDLNSNLILAPYKGAKGWNESLKNIL